MRHGARLGNIGIDSANLSDLFRIISNKSFSNASCNLGNFERVSQAVMKYVPLIR